MTRTTLMLSSLLLVLSACSFGGKPGLQYAGEQTVLATNARGASVEIDVKPLPQGGLTSPFGRRGGWGGIGGRQHKGIDYGAPRGTEIFAAADGCVIARTRQRGYGNIIIMRHAEGIETAYAHLDAFASGLRNGTCLRRGQTLGYVGSTGNSTGPHLHFEIRLEGNQVDPLGV